MPCGKKLSSEPLCFGLLWLAPEVDCPVGVTLVIAVAIAFELVANVLRFAFEVGA
jgi:hypothetical protein